MAGSPPNLHTMDSRSECIEGVLKVKVKVKGHVIRALFFIFGMSYSVIDGRRSGINVQSGPHVRSLTAYGDTSKTAKIIKKVILPIITLPEVSKR